MTPTGAGAIIIWNDVTPEGRDDFYAWHLNEHMPERLAIPGFQRGSRYIAVTPETKPEFLTLYETTNSSVAVSEPYLARLNAPTPWTKRATLHFRNTLRALTHVVAGTGCGTGGFMGTIRFDGDSGGDKAAEIARDRRDALLTVARLPRISGVCFCSTDTTASGVKTVESRHRSDILTAPVAAILVEGCDAAAVAHALASLINTLGLNPPTAHTGVYRLEHQRAPQ